MELNQLKLFLSAAEHGSLSAAARASFMTQQSLSKSVANLEQELGVPLFKRTSVGVELTSYGQVVAETAREMRSGEAAMLASLAALREENRRNLRLCISSSLLVDAAGFKGVLDRCEEVGLSVAWSDTPNGHCIQLLAQREADCAIVLCAEKPQLEGLRFAPLGSAQLYLTLDKKLPFAMKEELSGLDLSQLVVPAYDESMEGVIAQAIDREAPGTRVRFERIDPASNQFEMFLLTRCNATVVVSSFIRAARSNAHTVRPFPSDGWSPTVYLATRAQDGEASSHARASTPATAAAPSAVAAFERLLLAIPRPRREEILCGPRLNGGNEASFLEPRPSATTKGLTPTA